MRPEDENITYSTVENPQWVDSSHNAIICLVQFGHVAAKEDFIATPNDGMPYGKDIYWKAVNGAFGPITNAPPERLANLPPFQPGVAYLIGDLISTHPNQTIQSFIRIANTENHLGSEIGTVIAWTNILDETLKLILAQNGHSDKGTFNERINRSFAAGIITQIQHGLFHQVRRIRNPFGHQTNASLDGPPLNAMCDKLYNEAVGDDTKHSNRIRFLASCSSILADIIDRVQ